MLQSINIKTMKILAIILKKTTPPFTNQSRVFTFNVTPYS